MLQTLRNCLLICSMRLISLHYLIVHSGSKCHSSLDLTQEQYSLLNTDQLQLFSILQDSSLSHCMPPNQQLQCIIWLQAFGKKSSALRESYDQGENFLKA